MTDQDPDHKAAYQQLEDAILAVAEEEGFEGVITEWVVPTSHRRFDDDGTAICQNGKLLPSGQIPHHHIMGLLDFELTRLRAEAARDDE